MKLPPDLTWTRIPQERNNNNNIQKWVKIITKIIIVILIVHGSFLLKEFKNAHVVVHALLGSTLTTPMIGRWKEWSYLWMNACVNQIKTSMASSFGLLQYFSATWLHTLLVSFCSWAGQTALHLYPTVASMLSLEWCHLVLCSAHKNSYDG